VDARTRQILDRFETRADEIADEIGAAVVAQVESFGPIRDEALRGEIRGLAFQHVHAFLRAARSGTEPSAEELAFVRDRAARRAREMVPLAALLQAYLIAQRVFGKEIANATGTGADSRGAALALTAAAADYNIVTTSAMADAYVKAVQGDLAELETARLELVDALVTGVVDRRPELLRRAIGLGFDPEQTYVVALATAELSDGSDPPGRARRWAAEAIVRAAGRAQTFVVSRDRELVALLDAAGANGAREVLERAASALKRAHGAILKAGVGTPFEGLAGFHASLQEARRAFRHSTRHRPFVFGPDDLLLFDELAASGGDSVAQLIPDATRRALEDVTLRATLEAFIDADLSIADAAKALYLHPNSLRYRIRRIAELTGRDPRRLTDLLELIAAARLISATNQATADD
jgi:hypothetical protein